MNKDPFACRRKRRLYAKFFANTAARKTAHIEFGVSRPRPVGCQENIRAIMSRIVGFAVCRLTLVRKAFTPHQADFWAGVDHEILYAKAILL